MGLYHRRCVGQHHCHRFATPNVKCSQRSRKLSATGIGLCPAAFKAAVNNGGFSWIGAGGASDELNWALVALSDIELIVVPLEFFSGTGGKAHGFRRRLVELMSQALISGQKVGYMMGTLPAEARVAKFLLSISQKFRAMGFSDKSFHLRMTREDIGSYLGLTLETVSRTLSGFARGGYIRVDQKYIEIVDPDGLKLLRRLPSLKR